MRASIADQSDSIAKCVLEQIDCPLCADNRTNTVLTANDPSSRKSEISRFAIVRCSGCGLHYANPRPDTDSIAQFYSADYRPHLGNAHYDRPLRSWYPLDWIQPPLMNNPRPRLVLILLAAADISWLRPFVWAGKRQESSVSASAIEAVRENLGLPAFAGTLPHDDLEAESFDLVTMWHSLEHVHDPKRVLSEARRLLRSGGRVAIAVPNFDGWPRAGSGEIGMVSICPGT